jgi:hypothetical protein
MGNPPSTSLENPNACPGNAYWWSGFSTMQFAIENTWLKVNKLLKCFLLETFEFLVDKE